MALFRAPSRKVYVHPAKELSEITEELKSKVVFTGVPAEITKTVDFVKWLKTTHDAVDVLTASGWTNISSSEFEDSLPPEFVLHVRTSAVFCAPSRKVYIHPAEELSEIMEELKSKVAFTGVAAEITKTVDLVKWLETTHDAVDVLTASGWMKISYFKSEDSLPPEFVLHVRTSADDFQRRKKKKLDDDPRQNMKNSDIEDHSKEWAASVLTPYTYDIISDCVNLKKALAEPLLRKIPISPVIYKQLGPDIAQYFVSNKEYGEYGIIACHVSIFMAKSMEGGSENLLQSKWDTIFANFWDTLLNLTELQMVNFDRNVTDLSGASTPGKRPDLLLWSVHRLVAKFEEKKVHLHEAYEDLINELNDLPTEFYGPVNWIIGAALTGGQMCLWSMKKGIVPDVLCGPFNMKYHSSKYNCILVSVNLLRVALTLRGVFSDMLFMPKPYRILPLVTYGNLDNLTRQIDINWPKVIKTIKPWSSHVEEGFTKLQYVTAAYSLKVPQLIGGKCVIRRNDTYKVTLQEVGYELAITSEQAMRQAIKDVLCALKALHDKDLVHRDVRWKNILKRFNGGWMLIDLETVWKSGKKPTCRLQAWDGNTLDDGNYTKQSDLYLVGKLMRILPHIGDSFRRQLLDRAFKCADDALENEWLHEQ